MTQGKKSWFKLLLVGSHNLIFLPYAAPIIGIHSEPHVSDLDKPSHIQLFDEVGFHNSGCETCFIVVEWEMNKIKRGLGFYPIKIQCTEVTK